MWGPDKAVRLYQHLLTYIGRVQRAQQRPHSAGHVQYTKGFSAVRSHIVIGHNALAGREEEGIGQGSEKTIIIFCCCSRAKPLATCRPMLSY